MNSAPPALRDAFLPLLLLIATACTPQGSPDTATSPEGPLSRELSGPEPYLVHDLQLGTHDAFPLDLMDVNGTLYFSANDGLHGRELWKSDGTEAGTVLVMDIVPGKGSSAIRLLAAVDDTLYFIAKEQLWKTDGTAAGTTAIREGDLRFGHQYLSALHQPVATLNGALFFFAPGVGTAGKQLWRSDGTEAGTFPVSSELPADGSSAWFLSNVNGMLLFARPGPGGSPQLWKSDGTAAGTALIGNLPSDAGIPSYEVAPQVIGGTLFFGASGPELWKTDGTLAGTVLVKRWALGPNLSDLTSINGKLFFIRDRVLWESDGTSAGTVAFNSPLTWVSWLSSLGGRLLISASGGLYRSDGTPEGTTLLSQISGSGERRVVMGSTLFYAVRISFSSSEELWKTDGTVAGTTLVTTMTSGYYDHSDDTLPLGTPLWPPLVASGNLVFSLGRDGAAGYELWRSDGTSAGTFRARDINATGLDAYPRHLTTVGDTLFFTTSGDPSHLGLWKTDGTGVSLVKDMGALSGTPGIRLLTASGDKLLFSRYGLWASDGTDTGTVRIFDPDPTAILDRNGTAFFTIGDALLGKSDGTRAGTVVIKDDPNCCSGGQSKEMADVNGTLFFVGREPDTGLELWKSDGTGAGTVLVKDINPGWLHSNIQWMTPVNDKLFFTAEDDSFRHLWRSDGTAPGTRSLGVNADWLTAVNGTLFFTSGPRLWRSDGTDEGTFIVKSFPSGPTTVLPHLLTELNGTLFFIAPDGQTGQALWRSDGTEAGTVLVKNLEPRLGHAFTRSLTSVNGLLYFLAAVDGSDYELWRSDGTAAGTFAVSTQLDGLPLLLEATEAAPRMVKAHGRLFFIARDAVHGQELWAMPLSALTCPPSLAVEATSGDGAMAIYPPPAVAPDATGTPSFSYDPPVGSLIPLGTTQVSVSAPSLPPYLLSSCGFIVTVRDTTPPAIACPGPQFAKASSPEGAAVSFLPATATDAVTASPALRYSLGPNHTFPVGTTEVTVTATDDAGNATSCGFTVTVELEAKQPGGGCGATSSGVAAWWLLLVLAPIAGTRLRLAPRWRSGIPVE